MDKHRLHELSEGPENEILSCRHGANFHLMSTSNKRIHIYMTLKYVKIRKLCDQKNEHSNILLHCPICIVVYSIWPIMHPATRGRSRLFRLTFQYTSMSDTGRHGEIRSLALTAQSAGGKSATLSAADGGEVFLWMKNFQAATLCSLFPRWRLHGCRECDRIKIT